MLVITARFRLSSVGIAICATLNSSCSESSSTVSRTEVAVTNFREIRTPLLGRIRDLRLTTRNQLVILDGRIAPYITVLDLETDSVVAKFGVAGNGPGELDAPDLIDLNTNDSNTLWVLEVNQRQFTGFDLDSIPRVKAELAYRSAIALDAASLVRGGMLATGIFRDAGALFLGDSQFANPRALGDAPYRPADFPEIPVFDANWASLIVDHVNERVALAYRYAPIVRVLDFSGTVSADWRSPEGIGTPRLSPKEPWVPNFSPDSSDVAFLRVAMSDSGVFALHCGCRGSEVAARDSMTVQFYSWGKGYAGSFRVPSPVTAMASSSDGSRLLIAVERPEPTLYELTLTYAGHE